MPSAQPSMRRKKPGSGRSTNRRKPHGLKRRQKGRLPTGRNIRTARLPPRRKRRNGNTRHWRITCLLKRLTNGIVYTTDHRYVKILEIEPINFLLRSAREQQSIIYSFISYLKISPVKLQIKMISKKAEYQPALRAVCKRAGTGIRSQMQGTPTGLYPVYPAFKLQGSGIPPLFSYL